MNTEELTSRLAIQRAASAREGVPTAAQRRSDLHRLKQALLAKRVEFGRCVAADFGHRSAYETQLLDVIPVVQGIDYLRRRLHKWMRPERRHVALHFRP